MEFGALVSLAGYFILMLAIGFYAYRQSTDDSAGYLLGGRKLGPAVGALSAGASDMSGWMLLGLPGAVMVSGISEAWIAVGLTIGAFFNYLLVAPRLRVYTELAHDAITIPDYFEKRFDDKSRVLRILSAVVIIIFFTVYTSSGVVAGGKLFDASFGIDYRLGLFITTGVVIAYTLFGGFLAVSLTDFVQGSIMFVALILVPVVAIMVLGGFEGVGSQLSSVTPEAHPWAGTSTYLSWTQGLTFAGFVSLMAWGLGYFGQPHIIVRFMAIRTLRDIKIARHIGMTWMIITVFGAVATGLVGAAYLSAETGAVSSYLSGRGGIDSFDPETIFILLSQILFHPLIAGFLLAAILAAIMSTISSQLLVSSSSLTEDFYKVFLRKDASDRELVTIGRLCVLVVAVIAIGLAWDPDSNVLQLVSNAWFGFGSAFGPVILLSLYWKGMTRTGALAGMVVGASVVLFWVYGPDGVLDGLRGAYAAIIPGFILSSVAIVAGSALSGQISSAVSERHDEMARQVAKG